MTLKQVFHNASNIITGRWRQTTKSSSFQNLGSGDVPALSTGFSGLDKAIGLKGLPQGRITELIGPDSKGVLSIAAKIAAKFQRKQLPVLIIDMSNTFDRLHAVRCGLMAPDLLLQTPSNAFELLSLMTQAGRETGLVIVNLGFIQETFAQINPNLLKTLLTRLQRIASNSNSAFLYLTHLEEMNPFLYSDYPAGFPLHDIADIRLWVQDEGWIKRKQQITGYKGNITVIKNQLGHQGKGANLRIPFVDPEMARLTEELGF